MRPQSRHAGLVRDGLLADPWQGRSQSVCGSQLLESPEENNNVVNGLVAVSGLVSHLLDSFHTSLCL